MLLLLSVLNLQRDGGWWILYGIPHSSEVPHTIPEASQCELLALGSSPKLRGVLYSQHPRGNPRAISRFGQF